MSDTPRAHNVREIYNSTLLMWRELKAHRAEDKDENALPIHLCELIFQLKGRGDIAIKDIAKTFGITGSAVTQMVDTLEERGLVTRVSSEDDHRVTLVRLSPDSQEMAKTVRSRYEERLGEILSDLSDEEVETLSSLLSRIPHPNV